MTKSDLPVFDPTDPHYRYRWRATYQDGTVVDQITDGRSQSVSTLDWPRVKRIQLIPVWEGLKEVEVRVRPEQGERAIKFWQVDKMYQGPKHLRTIVREVLGIQRTVHGQSVKCFLLLDHNGGATLSMKQDIPQRAPDAPPVSLFISPTDRPVIGTGTIGWERDVAGTIVRFQCRRDLMSGKLLLEAV